MFAQSLSLQRSITPVGLLAPAVLLLLIGVVRAGELDRFEALADSAMVENRPSPETTKLLKDELLFQRATQTYLWALPLINTLGMKVGSEKTFGAGYNVLPVWKRRLDAKTLVTTPNSDVIYAMSYLDLGKDGPMVFEAPPGLQGILLDVWQRPIPGPKIGTNAYFGDVGLPGPDAGKGGKFLILPRGYDKTVPDGYFVYRSGTNNVFVFLRSFYEDPSNLTPAVALMEQAKIYPLGAQATAKPMQYPDASGVPVNMLPTSDGTAFDQLKLLVDSEGRNLADPDWLGMLAAIGIVLGQPFSPDAHARAILDRAARTAYKMSRVVGFEEVVAGRNFRIYPDRRWVNPIADGTPSNPGGAIDLSWRRVAGGQLDLDARIWFFTDYYSISAGMISQVPGRGAKYMVGFTDGDGAPLSGSASYRLTLPPNIPAANFWSLTLYEAENASGLANGQPFPSLGSRDKPVQEPDGSTKLFLGPVAPDGMAGNWLRTVPGRGYFAVLRLYSPTQAAIDKSWKPGDIEKIGAKSTVVQDKITEEYAKLVARDAYFWAWPLVNIENRRTTFAKVPQPMLSGPLPVAPPNRLTMLTDYIEPEERAVACPNQDVVYGNGVLALDQSPVVIQVPDFGDRFWVYQIVDGRTDSFASLGKMYGTRPGFYLLVGPDWQGEVPKGIAKVFRAQTNSGVVIPRVFQGDTPEDKMAVQPILRGIGMYPLADYDASMKDTDWSRVPKAPSTATGAAETVWVPPASFFDSLPGALANIPALPGEEGRYQQVQILLEAAKRNPRLKQAMNKAAVEADGELVQPLFEFRNYGLQLPHHWSTVSNGAAFGLDYFTRTAVAKSNIFVNAANETKYFYQDLDVSGTRLDGANRYTVTFAKDQTPPVNGFWSLTLYNAHHFFAPNELKRYSIGTKNKELAYNPDGSLTIYVQADPPAQSLRSNWLPAPKDANFSLYIRAYWPKVEITDGSWTPPAVEKQAAGVGARALQ